MSQEYSGIHRVYSCPEYMLYNEHYIILCSLYNTILNVYYVHYTFNTININDDSTASSNQFVKMTTPSSVENLKNGRDRKETKRKFTKSTLILH